MSIEVVRSGILDTIQDNGRFGYSKWGINPGGAMDRYASQMANALVGNTLNDAVIEFHFPGGALLFHQDCLISLTGADFSPHINAAPVQLWKTIAVKKDSILSFSRKQMGCRCYLAIHGGLNIRRWMGSVSTNLKISAGGLNGRALKKNDVIPLAPSRYDVQHFLVKDKYFFELPWRANPLSVYDRANEISFVEGNEWTWLTAESQHSILCNEFTIDPSSDRMGYYLSQYPLRFDKREELLSSAVNFGTIQALPGGGIAILMADHQTTGGYPRIGHVVTSHLPKLSQLGANDKVRLNKITLQAAEKMLFSLVQDLVSLQQTCSEKLNQYYAQH